MTQKETGSLNLSDVFQGYKIPTQDLNDPIDGQRFQQKMLGVACIHLGNKVIPHCTFFEIIESTEVFESSPEQQEEIFLQSDESSSLDDLASFALTNSLPPKKRRLRKMIRYDLVFTLDKKVNHVSSLATFYRFPREALTECLTTSIPHKLILSFLPVHLNNLECSCVLEEQRFKTKLEEFAAVCSHSCKLADQSMSEKRIQNILITNVSFELLQAIKQTSNVYEIMCQNMMELMKLHHEKVNHHRSEISSEFIIQLEEDNNNPSWSSDANEEEEIEEEEKTKPPMKIQSNNSSSGSTKKCLYCGSKSTPMWRRGPQGAGTLCNACGVKWKHGKILNGVDSVQEMPTKRGNMGEKKRKRSNAGQGKNKRKSKSGGAQEFAVPAPPTQQSTTTATWDTTSSSSTSESPVDSSPNTSPINLLQDKSDINSFISYNADALSIYPGEDAVEAAALLTLLKRS